MAKEKVFISGVAGFMGSHLADRFLELGHEVVGCDNLIGGYVDNVPYGVEFHVADCNDTKIIANIMDGSGIVYHCAATAYEGLSVFSPHFVTTNIVTATTGMVSAAIACGARRFVLCSSMARYGANEVPFTEDMTPRPQDPYGVGKLAAENLARNLAEIHGLELVVAVPHNIIGPRQKYDDPYRNVASIFINMMLQGKQPYIYGDGNQKRCFSFITDVIDPLCQMAFSDDVVGEVVNIGPQDEFVTINELAQTIAGLLDFDLTPRRVPGRPQEVYLANCSAAKARQLLGYEAKVSLVDGLSSMIKWIKWRGTREFSYHIDLEIINETTPKTWTKKLF